MDSDSDSERPVDNVAKKSRKPPNTAFRQQRLRAWQPILTPKSVIPSLLGVGVVFVALGVALLFASNQVQEIVIDYTHCMDAKSDAFGDIPSKYISYSFKGGKEPSNAPQWKRTDSDSSNDDRNFTCSLQFDIPTDMGSPIFMFYRLTNFYQNHRRYVQSFNEDQLNGKAVSASSLKSADDCKPLITDADGKPYYPCGLIANSYFNDTFDSPVLLNPSGKSNETYQMTDQGIAWSTDRDRFKKTKYSYKDVVPPPNWEKMFPHGYTEDQPPPDISEWESFQNWMRTAGLPKFSKLALRNDHDTLKSGTYSVDIGYNFPVIEYDGTKSMVLTTRTVIGGKNPFLGIAYLVVAGICIFLGLAFLVKHLIKPRRLGDHSYLSWNNDQGAAATGNDAAAAGGSGATGGVQRRF